MLLRRVTLIVSNVEKCQAPVKDTNELQDINEKPTFAFRCRHSQAVKNPERVAAASVNISVNILPAFYQLCLDNDSESADDENSPGGCPSGILTESVRPMTRMLAHFQKSLLGDTEGNTGIGKGKPYARGHRADDDLAYRKIIICSQEEKHEHPSADQTRIMKTRIMKNTNYTDFNNHGLQQPLYRSDFAGTNATIVPAAFPPTL